MQNLEVFLLRYSGSVFRGIVCFVVLWFWIFKILGDS